MGREGRQGAEGGEGVGQGALSGAQVLQGLPAAGVLEVPQGESVTALGEKKLEK